MSHATEGTIQAYLDGELTVAERSELTGHLAQCDACARELDTLRQASSDFVTLTGTLDVPVELERAREALDRERWARRSRTIRRVLTRAAVFLVFVAGAAAAAVPGSPLRRWVTNLWHNATAPRPAPTAPAAPTPAPEPSVSAVSVEPLQGHVRIVVRGATADTRVHVKLLDSGLASVEGKGAAAAAHYQTGPGQIDVRAVTGGDVIVTLPESATQASVELNGRVVVRKEGAQLHTLVPPVKRGDHELVFRPQS